MSDERRRLQRLEEVVDRLLGRQARVVVRGGVGGGGSVIQSVSVFPDIPGTPKLICFSGDGGLWFAQPGHEHWYPCSDWTDYDGTPGEEA